MKFAITRWSLPAIATMMLTFAGPAAAQDESQRQDRQSRSQNQQRDQQDRQQSQSQNRDQRSRGDSDDNQEALAHYRAGYYYGFRAGYNAGAEDSTLYVFELQGQRRGNQARSGQSESRRMSAERSGPRIQPKRREQLQGEVLKTKEVSFRNSKTKHLVALLKTENSGRRVADLGPVDQVRRLNLSEGDQVSVRGTLARVGDYRVLFANQVRSGDESVQIRFQHPRLKEIQSRQRGQMTSDRGQSRQGERERGDQNRNERRGNERERRSNDR